MCCTVLLIASFYFGSINNIIVYLIDEITLLFQNLFLSKMSEVEWSDVK